MVKQQILDEFHEITGIMLCVLNEKGDVLAASPNTGLFPIDFIRSCLQEYSPQLHEKGHPLIYIRDSGLCIGIARLYPGQILFLGPVRATALTEQNLLDVQTGYSHFNISEYLFIMNKTPIMHYRRFASALSIALELLHDNVVTAEDLIFLNASLRYWDSDMDAEITQSMFNNMEQSEFHTPTSYENAGLAAIESGDMEALSRFVGEPLPGRVGVLSKDYLMQEKFMFVSIATMVSRAAIRGGLDEEIARTMMDAYCQQIDEMNRPLDITALLYTMAKDYCQKVAEWHQESQNYSPVVRKCCTYISQHLHDEIGLNDISAVTGLSARVLSRKFRDETGYSISDYVHRRKINEAKYLLKHSDLGILDIGNYLKYNTQSYFTKIFKDITGCTPRRFREEAREG